MANPSMQNQIKQLEKKLKQYAEKDVPRAAVSALNKVAKPLTNIVGRAVAKREKIPSKLIKKLIAFHKATMNRRATYIKSFARGINVARLLKDQDLQKYMGKGNRKDGVAVNGRTLKGAFINRARKNGNVFVFDRRGKGRYPIDVKRLPIDEALMAVQLPLARDRFKQTFEKFYVQELSFRVGKYEQ